MVQQSSSERIETTILRNLFFNEDFTRKALPFLKSDYFQNADERTLFGQIEQFVEEYKNLPTKETINILYKYKETMVEHCKKKGYDGVICGHIHTPAIEKIGRIEYMNDGDWVESRTALVEHLDGTFELKKYHGAD